MALGEDGGSGALWGRGTERERAALGEGRGREREALWGRGTEREGGIRGGKGEGGGGVGGDRPTSGSTAAADAGWRAVSSQP